MPDRRRGAGHGRGKGRCGRAAPSLATTAPAETDELHSTSGSRDSVRRRVRRGPSSREAPMLLAVVLKFFGEECLAVTLAAAVALLRVYGLPKAHRLFHRAPAITSVLAVLGSTLVLPTVQAGKCAFTQECFQSGVDTDCTPVPAEGVAAKSFPMDAAHGFGVAHDKVWDGSVEDPSTGLCQEGTPDAEGRCVVDFVTPKGLKAVAPTVCPQYAGDGCCSWQQNYALYQNLGTLVDSFGSSTGCLACAVNLVNFWCALICSPHQGNFVSIHDPPFAQRADDLTGGSGRVLQADVTVDADSACRIYDSCKSVAIVGETTAMQSGLGLLKFQMQTGAVGHGEFFFLSFANVSSQSPSENGRPLPLTMPAGDTKDVPRPASAAAAAAALEVEGEKGISVLPASPSSSAPAYLSLDTLSCESFFDPGSSTIPFAYPPREEELISCTCDYCLAACSGGGSADVDVSDNDPIPVLDGFGFGLVGGVYAAVAVCSLTLFWWRRSQNKRHRRAAALWAWFQQH